MRAARSRLEISLDFVAMRTATLAVLLSAALLLAAAVGRAQEAEPDPRQCRAACAQTAERCIADATTGVEQCRETVRAPCDVWCPCTQFIGAAYFNCRLNCETCEAQIADALADCETKGQANRAECERARATCQRDCGS